MSANHRAPRAHGFRPALLYILTIIAGTLLFAGAAAAQRGPGQTLREPVLKQIAPDLYFLFEIGRASCRERV